LITLL